MLGAVFLAFASASRGQIYFLSSAGNVNFRENWDRGKIMLKTIDHVQLAMPEGQETEARNFYSGVLGLAEVAKPQNLAKRGGCWFAVLTINL